MLRFLSVLTLSLTLIIPSNATAGPLKWIARGGVVLCAKSASCSGAVARGVEEGATMGAGFLLKHYAPSAVERCLASPICLEYAYKISLGGAVASAAWKSLDSWMKQEGEDVSHPGVSIDDQTASIMPDPEDPFGENKKDEKEYIFKPTRKSLQHAYARHGDQWGFSQNANNQTLQRYEETLRAFMRSPDTVVKQGIYRGNPVMHYYNRATNLWVSVTKDGNIGGAWQLSEKQLEVLEAIGKVTMVESRSAFG
jgi:hypothetical protein